LALTPGTRLGVYDITAQIGVGGMGEVYRATDSNLKRSVAIKVLPASVAGDAERVERFQREAEVLAALNHPNIAAIYGLECSGDMTALVMELVEGEDLSQRIARGALPLDEALPIAKQIVDALEAAHERGIIHRDLKPANIKVRPDGTVKVLDFGLAKAIDPAGSSSMNAMNSPTLSIHATQVGIILGTAAYLSPEQAAGKPVDKRSDLWSFGVVVLEMLTGHPLFTGETLSHVLASVLKTDPDWTALPATTPAAVRRMLRRCLEKDRKRRLSDAADARLEIEEALTARPQEDPAGGANPKPAIPNPERSWRLTLPAAVAAAAVAAAAVLLFWAPWRRPLPASAPMRLDVALGADVAQVNTSRGTTMSLSPSGEMIAFVARATASARAQLYVRRLDQLHAAVLSGTDDAESPFFSPDGQWIAFFAAGKLKKISVAGGAAVTLCDARAGRGGAWDEKGRIVFSPDGSRGVTLWRVSSSGGTPEPLTSLAADESVQRWPQVLPGGNAVLFTSSGNRAFNDADLVIQPLPTGVRKVIQRGGYYGRYLPSGHVVYIHDGTLFAEPFDRDRLEVTGQAVQVLEGVSSTADSGAAQFAVSANGTLVYLPGQSTTASIPISWMDSSGKTTPLRSASTAWVSPRFDPDGHRIALQILDGQHSDIWIAEWMRDTLTRLTVDPARATNPVWTPDGRRLAFSSQRADKVTKNLYWQLADGTGDAERLTESRNHQTPGSWHPSGKFLAFEELNPDGQSDLMILPMGADDAAGRKPGKPFAFLQTAADEFMPAFSPDGRWLAYSSNESGQREVYVRPFPGPGGKWAISTGGGVDPTWSRTKPELYYGTNDGQTTARIMVASFTVQGDSFLAGKPRPWSDGRYVWRPSRVFDLHPDGERFALAAVAESPETKPDRAMFVFNFFDELRRVAPVLKR
jgi:serine/threonine-protein kinase